MELDHKMLNQVVGYIEDKKGGDITLLSLKGISVVTDYCFIVTGNTATQVKAITDHLEEKLPEMGIPIIHLEGLPEAKWVLMDCGGDLVIHIMTPDQREFYQLERLWKDAEVVALEAMKH
ncbi:iojap-like ribosome-associated protein [Desulfosporosinus orientis DSM 765]|uniref:Ribosomal silencing factor RsfS n=1 Tax=Desulfosporosinus orientis (strain ATCC 19365 / DSM 765 / NCIMB 8382 / VKM B-1628 / Singapore I) TaxID=768706 RepID=G7WJJ6_DESOD|nr:ribosome silencing factor [Desulfosporosinus orientis]AET70433.1 iojap-like ribosome-associated protein [Desulfosporosinus orientis DSM 765]